MMHRNTLGDLLRRSAARNPDKVAIIASGVRQTYRELDAAASRLAAALARRGVAQGDRVAILSRNHHAFVVAQFSIARLGAILVPINFMLQASEVAYILSHSSASAVLVEDSLVGVMDQALQIAERDIAVRGVIEHGHEPCPPAPWERVASWLDEPGELPGEPAVADDDPVQLLYTSGTESRPKGAMLTSRNLFAQYVSCIIDGQMEEHDVEVHALPLYHCAQLHCFLTPGLYLGATNIVLPSPDPATLLEVIEREKVSKLFCPPTVWIGLLRHPDFDRRDLSSLRKGYYGASIMPVAIIQELRSRLPAMGLFNFYGQTEMSPVATVLKPVDQMRKLGSAGRPAINVETRVVDDDDRDVPRGTIGEIVHRGPHVMRGYWNDEVRTGEVFRNGWFHSGDLGVMDEEGYLSVVDRKKDMIKTGGENVASREVEETLYRHPDVAEVSVFGVPHPRWIEAVAAAVVVKTGAAPTADSLLHHCRQHLAGYKSPKYIVLVDALPKNASGKVLKRELRLHHAALAGADPSTS